MGRDSFRVDARKLKVVISRSKEGSVPTEKLLSTGKRHESVLETEIALVPKFT